MEMELAFVGGAPAAGTSCRCLQCQETKIQKAKEMNSRYLKAINQSQQKTGFDQGVARPGFLLLTQSPVREAADDNE